MHLGSGTTTGNKEIHLEDHDDAYIWIEADEDNYGEDDNAYVRFSQDNQAVEGIIGTVGSAGKDPANVAYTGTLDNSFLIGARYWNGALQLGTNSAVRMTILQVGNVGIGTTTPQSELAVNGTITAKEVEVTSTGWPDHVFADGYRLMPLDEVETYIKANRHLPDMLSAAEVAENGVSLGDMQARLLQKVEELTLYVIELQKENEALKARMDRLEK